MNMFPGRDNIVRTVELKTPNAALVRPVGKICLLEKMDKITECHDEFTEEGGCFDENVML